MTEQEFIAYCCSDEGWEYLEALAKAAKEHGHISIQALWALYLEAQKQEVAA